MYPHPSCMNVKNWQTFQPRRHLLLRNLHCLPDSLRFIKYFFQHIMRKSAFLLVSTSQSICRTFFLSFLPVFKLRTWYSLGPKITYSPSSEQLPSWDIPERDLYQIQHNYSLHPAPTKGGLLFHAV
ncbi:MAG: hypothetical protein CM1200mP28_08480 [Deltaproteobacteria bacterium]|nr:MAG: hypothetical protein CM1200mP28_08480 [Deltaproteobacteria bacterium]